MPAERLSMRKIREVLRLHFDLGLSARQAAAGVGIARSTAGEYLRRAQAAGLSWERASGLADDDLDRLLFPPPSRVAAEARPLPDWALVRQELRRPKVTLFLLWLLCRRRHKSHYADVRIMPTSGRKAWSVAVPALLRSA
jgi:hypothetical protein